MSSCGTVSALTPPQDECDAMQFGAGQCRCLICARCGHHTGNANQGHYWSWCKVTRSVREFHFCCPDEEHGCELEAAPGAEAAAPDGQAS